MIKHMTPPEKPMHSSGLARPEEERRWEEPDGAGRGGQTAELTSPDRL